VGGLIEATVLWIVHIRYGFGAELRALETLSCLSSLGRSCKVEVENHILIVDYHVWLLGTSLAEFRYHAFKLLA